MTRSELLPLVLRGDFAAAFHDRDRLRAVCRELSRCLDTELSREAADLAEAVARPDEDGAERWAALAAALREPRAEDGHVG